MKEGLEPVPEELAEEILTQEKISEDEFLTFMYGMIEQYLGQMSALEDTADEAMSNAQMIAKEVRRLRLILESIQLKKQMGNNVAYFQDSSGGVGYHTKKKPPMGFNTEKVTGAE